MEWVTVTTAPNEPIGESWAGLLRERGIPAIVRGESVLRVYLGSGMTPVRIMVPVDKEAEGLQVLEDLLGEDEGSPEEGR